MKIFILLVFVFFFVLLVGVVLVDEFVELDMLVLEILGFVEWLVMNDISVWFKVCFDIGVKILFFYVVNVEGFKKGEEDWVKF